MSSPPADPEQIASVLERARAGRAAVVPPEPLTQLTLEGAYAVQDALAALREAGGARRSGWKLGLTSPVKQAVMGIAHPLFGRLFADGERADGASVDLAAYINPRTEPEIAFGLDRPLDAAMDAAQLRACIAWIAPALEITDSRYLPGTRTPVELVADNTSAAGYVLGPRRRYDGGALDGFAAELVRDGEVVMRGSSGDVLGDPVRALALLAAHLASRGAASRAGDVVLSGAITDAIPLGPGMSIEVRLAGVGNAGVTIVGG